MKLKQLTLILGIAVATSGVTRATNIGVSIDPMGAAWNRGDAGTGFAVFDTFPSFDYSGDGPDSSGGLTSALLSQSNTVGTFPANQGAGTYKNVSTQETGDDIYLTGNRGGTFTASIDAPFTIKQVYLQIKRVSSTGDLTNYTPTLPGGRIADSVTTVSGNTDTGTSDSGNYSVTTWYWGPSLFAVNFTNPVSLSFSIPATSGNTRAIDGFVIDASSVTVPEPASLSLLACGAMGLLARHRRFSHKILGCLSGGRKNA
ncbi:MAG TPA: PEP-CTERM sorting domain-containing protein [Tepidisphaeraceae bacterium]|nr:PEP-CTERM sorting domain-containing protein [Tepidisphaeraceae bacterium]